MPAYVNYEEDIDGTSMVCGIFSLIQVEKQLGTAIPLTEVAKTFAAVGDLDSLIATSFSLA